MTTETKKIKTLIVDDEPLARRTIRDLLATDIEIEIIGEAGSGSDAVGFIRKQTPDLLFLDIQMPGMNGFEALSKIEHERIPAIIFVTAFDQYALKAFDVHALDYLLKPFTDERFFEALHQAKTQIEMREVNRLSQSLVALLGEHATGETSAHKRKNFLTRFMIRAAGRVIFINAFDVDWIAADDYYIKLHVGGKTHLLRMSMNELEEKLDPKNLLRIHRSTIVNLEFVKELYSWFSERMMVLINDGKDTELTVARDRVKTLKERLGV